MYQLTDNIKLTRNYTLKTPAEIFTQSIVNLQQRKCRMANVITKNMQMYKISSFSPIDSFVAK